MTLFSLTLIGLMLNVTSIKQQIPLFYLKFSFQYIFDLICFWLKDSHRILISIQCNKLATILNMCWSICKATACKLFKLLEFFNDAKKHRNSCLVFYRINFIALKHFAINRISFVMSLSNNIFMHYKSKKD